MTIEQLDACKVLISLGSEDMKNFELQFENMSFYGEHSRRVLLRLLQLACMKAGMSYKSKSVLMEALPLRSGCLILVTMMEEKQRKTYKVKSVTPQPCFVFESAEELLSAAQEMFGQNFELHGNSLWLSEGRYFLVLESPLLTKKAREILGEYGAQYKTPQVQLARIKERGRLLHGGNALEYIGRKIIEQSSQIKPEIGT